MPGVQLPAAGHHGLAEGSFSVREQRFEGCVAGLCVRGHCPATLEEAAEIGSCLPAKMGIELLQRCVLPEAPDRGKLGNVAVDQRGARRQCGCVCKLLRRHLPLCQLL